MLLDNMLGKFAIRKIIKTGTITKKKGFKYLKNLQKSLIKCKTSKVVFVQLFFSFFSLYLHVRVYFVWVVRMKCIVIMVHVCMQICNMYTRFFARVSREVKEELMTTLEVFLYRISFDVSDRGFYRKNPLIRLIGDIKKKRAQKVTMHRSGPGGLTWFNFLQFSLRGDIAGPLCLFTIDPIPFPPFSSSYFPLPPPLISTQLVQTLPINCNDSSFSSS